MNICKKAFNETDLDNSRTITEGELYVAVLLLYNNINVKIPGRNHVAPSFSVVRSNFQKYVGKEENATLNEEQFIVFCQDMCIELMPRVVMQAIGSLFLAPVVAVGMYTTAKYWCDRLGLWWLMIIPEPMLTPLFASIFMMI